MKILLNGLLIAFILSCSVSTDIEPERINNVDEWNQADKELLNIIQDYRVSLNLPIFTPNKDIRDIAIERLNIVKLTKPISHDGVGQVFISVKSLGFILPKELLGYGYSTNQKAFEAFVRSGKHNKALLENNKYIGVHSLIYNDDTFYIILFAN